jgi:hypothetical protein
VPAAPGSCSMTFASARSQEFLERIAERHCTYKKLYMTIYLTNEPEAATDPGNR